MIILSARFIPLTEADIGQIDYYDFRNRILRLDCELLVAEDELTVYGEELGVSEYPEEINIAGAPFRSWDDLINAVRERTPQSKTLKRYLESVPYTRVLKSPVTEISDEGEAVTKLAPFTLTHDQLGELNVKVSDEYTNAKEEGKPAQYIVIAAVKGRHGETGQAKKFVRHDCPKCPYFHYLPIDNLPDIIECPACHTKQQSSDIYDPAATEFITYKRPADYNRYWFQQLQKYVPRAMEPPVHGGKLYTSSAHGSKKWAEQTRKPLVPAIVNDHISEINAELLNVFGTLGKWTGVVLGHNLKNVKILIDKRAAHLSSADSPISAGYRLPSMSIAMDVNARRQLAHLQRTKRILQTQSETGERLKLARAIRDIDRKIHELASQYQEPKYKIFLYIDISMNSFVVGLKKEISTLEPTTEDEYGYKEIATSLVGINGMIRHLDPTGSLGLRGDLFKIIEMAIDESYKIRSDIVRISNDGVIVYKLRSSNWTPAEFAQKMDQEEYDPY